jgi:hypothetical protein
MWLTVFCKKLEELCAASGFSIDRAQQAVGAPTFNKSDGQEWWALQDSNL